MPRRWTAGLMEQVPELATDRFTYYQTSAARPSAHGPAHDAKNRALFIFLHPSTGPQGADDFQLLRRSLSGLGVGPIMAAYLFTDTSLHVDDIPRAGDANGPLADSVLRAGLRWLDRPDARLQSGRLFLAHGQPWKSSRGNELLHSRLSFLWDSMRTFKRHAHSMGPVRDLVWPYNPLAPMASPQGAGTSMRWLEHPGDHGPLPGRTATAWHRLPR